MRRAALAVVAGLAAVGCAERGPSAADAAAACADLERALLSVQPTALDSAGWVAFDRDLPAVDSLALRYIEDHDAELHDPVGLAWGDAMLLHQSWAFTREMRAEPDLADPSDPGLESRLLRQTEELRLMLDLAERSDYCAHLAD